MKIDAITFGVALFLVGVIALAVYAELENPCMKWEDRPMTAYYKAGDVLVPFQTIQRVCTERKKK